MRFDLATLDNGLKLVGLRLAGARSVSLGFWIGTGSQYEAPEEGGLSHLIEHMAFKGTEKYTTRRIAEEMDAVGGHLNAFTSKECTCFYTRVVEDRLELAMDVLSEMVIRPRFDPAELEKERGVVLEEIAMCEDTPEDLVYELLMQAHFGDQPIARPILGTGEAIEGYSDRDIRGYWRRTYSPVNTVLAVAGAYDWDRVTALAEQYCGEWRAEAFERRTVHTGPAVPGILWRERDIEQVHICLGLPGLPYVDDDIHELALLCGVLGGSMSSRLFQRIREDTGAAYTVYSSENDYTDCGMLSVYAATAPKNADRVLSMLFEELRLLAKDGITRREFAMAREQIKADYILSLESTSARMQSIGRRLLLLGETKTEDQVLERIDRIDFDKVNALAARFLNAPCSVAVVGEDAEALAVRAGRR
ncbi:MAG: insulinase family protein [Clostridia bacterium]|nr:insulinase family protein [Clostridia bacterium]